MGFSSISNAAQIVLTKCFKIQSFWGKIPKISYATPRGQWKHIQKVILFKQGRVCVYAYLIVNNLYIMYVERELGLELGLGLGFLYIYVNI